MHLFLSTAKLNTHVIRSIFSSHGVIGSLITERGDWHPLQHRTLKRQTYAFRMSHAKHYADPASLTYCVSPMGKVVGLHATSKLRTAQWLNGIMWVSRKVFLKDFSLPQSTDLPIDIHKVASEGNAGKYKDVNVPRFRVNKQRRRLCLRMQRFPAISATKGFQTSSTWLSYLLIFVLVHVLSAFDRCKNSSKH